jgi:hypothetical protein
MFDPTPRRCHRPYAVIGGVLAGFVLGLVCHSGLFVCAVREPSRAWVVSSV